MNATDRLTEVVTRLAAAVELGQAGMQAALVQTANANRLRGARAMPAPGGGGGRPLLWGGPGRLVGWSVRASGGWVNLILTDSRDGTGEQIASIALADGKSDALWAGPGGVSFGEGLFVTVLGTGTLTGAFWLGAVD